MPIAAAAVQNSCWWIFSCLLLFFSNIKAMVCIYHNNCSKEFNTIAPLKRIKKHIFFSNFSFILLIKFWKNRMLTFISFRWISYNLLNATNDLPPLGCLVSYLSDLCCKCQRIQIDSNFTKIFFFFLALRNFPSNYIFWTPESSELNRELFGFYH